MKNILFAFFAMFSFCVFAQEETNSNHHHENNAWSSSRPDGHAPISVMADHVHHKNEWMFSYRFMSMKMKDLQDGENVFDQYMSAPEEMSMDMHMFGAMYAPFENLTFMLMGNYRSNTMTSNMNMVMPHGMSMEMTSEMKSEGFGDISVSALYRIFNKNKQSMHAQLGVVLPTGSIDEKGNMEMMDGSHEMLMAPAMQPGSGSFSTKFGLTYLWQNRLFSAGAQTNALVRINENDHDYQLGNQYNLIGWMAIKTTDFLSFSLRGKADYVEEIKGIDPRLDPMMSSTADPDNSGGFFTELGIGTNILVPGETLKGLRFGVEFGLPIYQDPNGTQLKNEYSFIFGTQYSF